MLFCVCVKYQLKQGDEIKSYHSSHSSSIHNQQLISEGCDAVGDGDATQKAGASKSRFRMRRRSSDEDDFEKGRSRLRRRRHFFSRLIAAFGDGTNDRCAPRQTDNGDNSFQLVTRRQRFNEWGRRFEWSGRRRRLMPNSKFGSVNDVGRAQSADCFVAPHLTFRGLRDPSIVCK